MFDDGVIAKAFLNITPNQKQQGKRLIHLNIFIFIYYIFWQDFVLTKQVLYHLSHVSSPFCSGYFGDGVS
jgi:hypothetical protein